MIWFGRYRNPSGLNSSPQSECFLGSEIKRFSYSIEQCENLIKILRQRRYVSPFKLPEFFFFYPPRGPQHPLPALQACFCSPDESFVYPKPTDENTARLLSNQFVLFSAFEKLLTPPTIDPSIPFLVSNIHSRSDKIT